MQSLNIVSLVESNPITKLSNVYNNKFLEKIKENFTEMEQQLFVSSFYCYLNYNQTTDFVIDLDNIWKWLEFKQKINSKMLLEKHFVIDKDYKNLTNHSINEIGKKHGGHNKETIMLTVKTFKLFCIKADTKKANEIHEYFIKLEELLQQIVHAESDELKLQLDQANTVIETNKIDFKQKVCKEREQFLLREFGSIGSIVYIIKVKTFENGEYVIKIGESRRGIESRYNEHKSKYDEILLLDCFAVKKSKDFENFLHKHDNIRFTQVTNLPNHETEKELFLIGKELTYKTLLHIINTNIKHFNDFNETDLEKLKTENAMLKELLNPTPSTLNDISSDHYKIQIQELVNGQKEMMVKLQYLEKTNKEIMDKLNVMTVQNEIKTTTNFNQPLVTLGPRLQQINPENMSINKVYESIAECIKESNFKMKRPSIMKAVSENTIYNGFRWAYVDRNSDPNSIATIPETKITRVQNIGYIAKLDKDKTEILNVYLDRKTAAISNGYISMSALDVPVKKVSLTNNHYYILYNDCSHELQQKFIEKNGNREPILYKDGVGRFSTNNQLLQEFVCKYDCIKQLKMSDKTLAKALDKDVVYNNHYFKSIGSKIQI